jgi:hypothetical protein
LQSFLSSHSQCKYSILANALKRASVEQLEYQQVLRELSVDLSPSDRVPMPSAMQAMQFGYHALILYRAPYLSPASLDNNWKTQVEHWNTKYQREFIEYYPPDLSAHWDRLRSMLRHTMDNPCQRPNVITLRHPHHQEIVRMYGGFNLSWHRFINHQEEENESQLYQVQSPAHLHHLKNCYHKVVQPKVCQCRTCQQFSVFTSGSAIWNRRNKNHRLEDRAEPVNECESGPSVNALKSAARAKLEAKQREAEQALLDAMHGIASMVDLVEDYLIDPFEEEAQHWYLSCYSFCRISGGSDQIHRISRFGWRLVEEPEAY